MISKTIPMTRRKDEAKDGALSRMRTRTTEEIQADLRRQIDKLMKDVREDK